MTKSLLSSRSQYVCPCAQVISSFYVEWGGNSLSFMGKGVTKNALISLLHLSHEMMAQNKAEVSVASLFFFSAGVRQKKRKGNNNTYFSFPDQDFIGQWSLGNEAATEDASASQLGLAWLIPLWVDRDQEVLRKKKQKRFLTVVRSHRFRRSPCSSRSQTFRLHSECMSFWPLFCLFADA